MQNNPSNYAEALADFLRRYPEYEDTRVLDHLRARDYARLDQQNQVYLDYTGGGLYGISQVQKHAALLEEQVFGNPHSNNPTSLASTQVVEQAREAVLEFFNASVQEYDLVFTPNASGALKLVGEAYPFAPDGRFTALFDNHNSVNGLREFARQRGAAVTYVPLLLPDLRMDEAALSAQLELAQPGSANLLAYPAQSNFSGAQHALDWIEKARQRGWDVLLDCAAFAPTNRLDLNQCKPDFIPISFYKMFGYPTGIGCLLARRSALAKLRRPWFAGGTITITSVQGEGWHYLINGHAGFEDGTVNYLGLPALEIGLKHLAAVGMDTIHERVMCLTGWLLQEMAALRHSNGAPACEIYGPTTTELRGATIAFNLLDPQGQRLDYHRVEALASQVQISLRTGCFCNPGAGEITHQLSREDMAQAFQHDSALSFDQFFNLARSIFGKHPSTIRISMGLVSNFADVYRFMTFIRGLLDLPAATLQAFPAYPRQRDSA